MQRFITKTCLYNFDPLKPHFYIEKLGFTGCTLFFLFLLKNIDCGYSLELPCQGSSNEYPQSMFWEVLTSTHNLCFEQKYEKYQSFLSINFQFLEVKFSIYLNKHVFEMRPPCTAAQSHQGLCCPLVYPAVSDDSVGGQQKTRSDCMYSQIRRVYHIIIWASTWQNLQNGMCAKRRLRSAWAPLSLISLCCLHKAWVLSCPLCAQQRLIRLGRCPGWSESSLGAHAIL